MQVPGARRAHHPCSAATSGIEKACTPVYSSTLCIRISTLDRLPVPPVHPLERCPESFTPRGMFAPPLFVVLIPTIPLSTAHHQHKRAAVLAEYLAEAGDSPARLVESLQWPHESNGTERFFVYYACRDANADTFGEKNRPDRCCSTLPPAADSRAPSVDCVGDKSFDGLWLLGLAIGPIAAFGLQRIVRARREFLDEPVVDSLLHRGWGTHIPGPHCGHLAGTRILERAAQRSASSNTRTLTAQLHRAPLCCVRVELYQALADRHRSR